MLPRLFIVLVAAALALVGGCASQARNSQLWVVETDRPVYLKVQLPGKGAAKYQTVTISKPGRTPVWADADGRITPAIFFEGETVSIPVDPPREPSPATFDYQFVGVAFDGLSIGSVNVKADDPGVVVLKFRPQADRMEAFRFAHVVTSTMTEDEVQEIWGPPTRRTTIKGLTAASWGETTLFFRFGEPIGSSQ